MAKKALSAPEIPLCINVLRLLNYRLAPDELILFDWLTVKQISFKYKPFHYSQARVEEKPVSAVPGRKSSLSNSRPWAS